MFRNRTLLLLEKLLLVKIILNLLTSLQIQTERNQAFEKKHGETSDIISLSIILKYITISALVLSELHELYQRIQARRYQHRLWQLDHHLQPQWEQAREATDALEQKFINLSKEDQLQLVEKGLAQQANENKPIQLKYICPILKTLMHEPVAVKAKLNNRDTTVVCDRQAIETTFIRSTNPSTIQINFAHIHIENGRPVYVPYQKEEHARYLADLRTAVEEIEAKHALHIQPQAR